jgi:CheY-like chemotaxis protein
VSHTLLLADDSVTIQRVIELTFADEDVNVVAVSNGDEAIAVMDRTPPDIVLADVGMPGRNGYEVAEHIRDTPRLAHIPIVLLTGAFEPIDQAKATSAGCDGVLAKPFEPQIVIGRVKELLSKPKQAASLDAALPPPLASGASWASSLPEPPLGSTPNPVEAGDYFERLDQAFASLSAGPAAASRPNTSSPPGATARDWFASQPPPAETPRSFEPTPPSPFESAASRPFDAGQMRSAEVMQSAPASTLPDRWDVRPSAPAPPPDLPYSYASAPPPPAFDYGQSKPPIPPPLPLPTLPPLADAFAALLAAEQASPSPIAAAVWPSLPQPPSPTPAVITDEVIEHIVRRVLDQLSDRVLREAVEEKVTTIAERLVREEIARIKASIR